MIDILPSSRSAIFTDAPARKLPKSFYWGAGFALLLHAGLVYYLVQQNFNHTLPDDVPLVDRAITVSTYTPPQPPPPAPTKPVNIVAIHDTPAPAPTTQTLTLPPQPQSDTSASGVPVLAEQPQTPGPVTTTVANPGPVYVTPHWKAFPDAATLTDYYPPRALDNEVEGAATVQCTVLDTAGHVHCSLVSESPKGYGFGQQTVKMVEEKGRVDTSAGDIKVGSVLATTTVKWQMN